MIGALYWFLTRNLEHEDKLRVLSLCILIPVMAISLLTNQEIFNAYLVWGDQHFNLQFMQYTMPSSWLITLDAALSFSMLVAVALFWKWWSLKRREPDEITKIIIGSVFTIAGGLCLFAAAAVTPAGGKVGLFWPVMPETCTLCPGAGANRQRASQMARMVSASAIANRAPTQVRGPAPKGKYW